ncbi:MAG: GTP-binding protein [Tissierellia bacterium]|nr:GTP-binding protein [Tissierellia bacterium]
MVKIQVVIIGGPTASGKTSIALRLIETLQKNKVKISVVKIDCLNTDDHETYKKLGVNAIFGLSQDICPDHFLATNFIEIYQYGKDNNSNVLIIETAGLCNRCAPFLNETLNICLIDAFSSFKTPKKMGPMLTTADIMVITKWDMISRCEKDVLKYNIKELNPTAKIIEMNGVSGYGKQALSKEVLASRSLESLEGSILKHQMPCATCSYCAGETRIGKEFEQGIVSKIFY